MYLIEISRKKEKKEKEEKEEEEKEKMNPVKVPKTTPTLFWTLKNDFGIILFV